jgi:alpha-D-xyloside xylohydrolase
MVYPGADGDFTLYNDDGVSYAYEKGESHIAHLHWNDATHKLTQSGDTVWSGAVSPEIVAVQ